ncbi:MAG: hypothetical protein GY730_09605 [bacterium]|nr:hypothetical protein [bacterium]
MIKNKQAIKNTEDLFFIRDKGIYVLFDRRNIRFFKLLNSFIKNEQLALEHYFKNFSCSMTTKQKIKEQSFKKLVLIVTDTCNLRCKYCKLAHNSVDEQ